MKEKILEKLQVLTPITECDGIYYKRDDLFTPFDDGSLTDKYIEGINGTKLRQALSLLINNYDKIKNECNNTIVAHQSSSTQQGILITSCANIFDIRTLLVTGNLAESSFEDNVLVYNAKLIGAEFDNSCNIAYNTVLDAKVSEFIENNNYFNFNFVDNCISNYDSIVLPVSYQCKNIPDDVEQVVVPAGNSIIFASIIIGCAMYKPTVKKVIGIQISGMNRSDTVSDILEKYLSSHDYNLPDVDFILDKTYSYSTMVDVELSDGTKLDPIYEAKAYNYMTSKLDMSRKTLFWIAGSSLPSRIKKER